MRKLRKAALVAAMIGSLSMAGAGVASATDYGKSGDGKDAADFCVNNNEQANVSGLLPILNNVNIGILGTAAPTNTVQQSCTVGDHGFSGNAAEVKADNDFLDLLG